MRISDWSSDVCSSDLEKPVAGKRAGLAQLHHSEIAGLRQVLDIVLGISFRDDRHLGRGVDGEIVGGELANHLHGPPHLVAGVTLTDLGAVTANPRCLDAYIADQAVDGGGEQGAGPYAV